MGIDTGIFRRMKIYSILLKIIILSFSFVQAKKTLNTKVTTKVSNVKQGNGFHGVTEKLGIFIWRIEDFSPVPWDTNKYGSFHTGDSYMVLNSKKVNGKITRDLHFWLGNQTSQDEMGSAAILTVMLDHILGGGANQHREVQYEESSLFKSYFHQGIRYLNGGVKSGFRFIGDITPNRRLLIVKGRRNVKASQVPIDISSLNLFDTFILDSGKGGDIMIFRPKGTNNFEKIKATAVANDIKNEDHAGKGKVIIFDESENDDMRRFFEALGSGSMTEVSNIEIDDVKTDFSPKLCKINGKRCMPISSPLNQNLFVSDQSYLLFAGKTIFLWHGRMTSKQQRMESKDALKKYILDNKLDKNIHLNLVLEGLEEASFKQFFPSWKGLIDTKSWKSVTKTTSQRPMFSGPQSIKSVPDWNIKDLHIKKQRKI